MSEPDMRRDQRGHFKGCLFYGCAMTACREALAMAGPSDADFLWVLKTTRGSFTVEGLATKETP